jgi:presenilin-like A22 family membrane protease
MRLRWKEVRVLIHILIVSAWIVFTLAFYYAVAVACRRLRPSAFMVKTYAAVRSAVDGHSWWRWYAFLFVGTLVVTSICLRCAMVFSEREELWYVWTLAATGISMGYAVLVFWPKPENIRVNSIRLAVATMTAMGYVFVLYRWPNWVTLDIGVYVLSVPPLVWLRALRIRTATCLLTAAAIYDALHVFGTGWMQVFMHNIAGTAFVLQIPSGFSLDATALCTIGHGDILGSGVMLVVAARAPDRLHASWLVIGTLIGTGTGLALSTLYTIQVHSLPALIVLGPCSFAGYGLAFLTRRVIRPAE